MIRDMLASARRPPGAASLPSAPAPDAVPSCADAAVIGGSPARDTRPWDPTQRPAVLLGRSADGAVTLANVRWGLADGKPVYRDTTIAPGRVKNVYLCLERFPPEWLAAHSFLAFELDPPLRAANGDTDGSLVVSMEARLRQGQSFSLLDGLHDAFGSVYQLGTWGDVVQKTCGGAGHTIERYPLALDDAQKQQLLHNSLHEALVDRSEEHYNTYNNSCFTNAVRQLNTVLPCGERLPEWWVRGKVHDPLSSMPVAAGFLLDAHHLLQRDAPIVVTAPPGKMPPPDRGTPIRCRLAPALEAAATISLSAAGAAIGHVPGALLGSGAGLWLAHAVGQAFDREARRVYEAAPGPES